ncbi:MAG: 4-hydroxy-3-methylbut-2-enyl diphosphate reductase [Burkholderiaceae bacterium]|nr:4-hydroxy-3-methylbut-2-enyl diphosphate reductase [Burkholderiaceae bacterium]
MKVLLAQPRGFCAGVDRAIAIVERALVVHGAPIYVRHEIVHNKYVVNTLRNKGAIFVNEVSEVPDNSVLVFSAHGVPRSVEDEARARKLKIYDATCPLVTKVHAEVAKMHRNGYQIIMIGHKGHPEVEGTVGQVPSEIEVIESPEQVQSLDVKDPEKVAYVSQTTISHDDAKKVIQSLKERFPQILEPKKADICYATQNRQDAVKELAKSVDLVLVVGSKTSSNSNRLREVAEKVGTRAYLIDGASELDEKWFDGVKCIGITAGASAPEILVEEIIEKLKSFSLISVTTMSGVEENVEFPLPKVLWKKDVEAAILKDQ